MLTYKNIRLLHAILSSLAIIGFFFYSESFLYVVIGLALVYLGVVVFGVFHVRTGFFLPMYNRGTQQGKQLALTFDDGPSPQTLKVLDILKKYNLRATFFLIGSRIEANEEVLKRIVAEGHQIGNHTFHHKNGTGFYSAQKLTEEIQTTQTAVKRLVGLNMKLFRPPFGVTTPNLAKVVSQLRLNTIGWTVRSFDTTGKPLSSIVDRILAQAAPGGVILLHDDREKCQEVLERILPPLLAQQYTFTTIAELFTINAYEN